jgi:LmbE family N-acetylglucosaminyl deacetylase
MTRRAFAVCAHPDDIEFSMAGTMILLGQAGYELHYMTIANGSCGTEQFDRDTIVRMRSEEARSAAHFMNAFYHEPLTDDLNIFYERGLLLRLSSIMRQVAPEILLTHYPFDYMEDHSNTCRLVLTAAFTRGMPNYAVNPPQPAVDQPVTVYHALPHGLRDPLKRPVIPDFYVDIATVLAQKREMLAMHRSQKEWLDRSQGMDSYLNSMEQAAQEVGMLSGKFQYAEGWIRHLHLGYCAEEANPLVEALEHYTSITSQ